MLRLTSNTYVLLKTSFSDYFFLFAIEEWNGSTLSKYFRIEFGQTVSDAFSAIKPWWNEAFVSCSATEVFMLKKREMQTTKCLLDAAQSKFWYLKFFCSDHTPKKAPKSYFCTSATQPLAGLNKIWKVQAISPYDISAWGTCLRYIFLITMDVKNWMMKASSTDCHSTWNAVIRTAWMRMWATKDFGSCWSPVLGSTILISFTTKIRVYKRSQGQIWIASTPEAYSCTN